MFTKVERLISSRNLRPKKKEGFLKIISIFSFLGIMLGVAILIIVMSVMNGFRSDLIKKINGFNSHATIQSYDGQFDLKKVEIAFIGLSTIGSPFKFNEVFSKRGMFDKSKKFFIKL